MPGEIRTDIPADEVPRFPVLRLVWGADGTITLDGTPLDLDGSDDPRIGALLACAEHARRRGGDQPTIRVIATDEASQQTWPMAVTGDGDIIELTAASEGTPDTAEDSRTSRRRALLIGSGILGAALIGGGGITTALIVTGRDEPESAPPPPPPGQGDLIPVSVPQGYSTTAAWSTAVAPNTQAIGMSDGRTLTTAPDSNNLRIHAPDTGDVVWTGTGNTNALRVAEVSIDGRPFLIALDSTGVLKLWPLDLETKTAVTNLELPAREATLYTSGPVPAVGLPTQSGYIFQGSEGVALDLPVGFRLIGGTVGGKAIVLGERHWGTLEPGEKKLEKPIELLLPSKKHSIEGGFPLGESRLLVRIAGPDETTWALYATDASNALVTTPTTSSGRLPDPAELLHNAARTIWAVDDVLATEDSLVTVETTQTLAVTDLGVYADTNEGPVLINPVNGEMTLVPEDTTPPAIASTERAVIVTDKLDTPTAYTVEATS